LKFIQFEPITLNSALSKATDGIYLFIDNDITLQTSSNPNLEYAICRNLSDDAISFNLSLLSSATDESDISGVITNTSAYQVKAQLKDSYAVRFQALASHHIGRVGVDFVKYEQRIANSVG